MRTRGRWTFDDDPAALAERVPRSGGYKNQPAPLTQLQLGKILGVFEAGGNGALAARSVGRSERWLQYMQEAYPALRARIHESMEVADGEVQRSMHASAMLPGKDGVADRIFWLKNRKGWADRALISQTVDVHLLPQLLERAHDPEVLAEVRAEVEQRRQRYLSAGSTEKTEVRAEILAPAEAR